MNLIIENTLVQLKSNQFGIPKYKVQSKLSSGADQNEKFTYGILKKNKYKLCSSRKSMVLFEFVDETTVSMYLLRNLLINDEF